MLTGYIDHIAGASQWSYKKQGDLFYNPLQWCGFPRLARPSGGSSKKTTLTGVKHGMNVPRKNTNLSARIMWLIGR